MSTFKDWCRVVEHDGVPVLMTRGYDDEMERYVMRTTLQLHLLIEGDHPFGETTITLARGDGYEDEPFTDQEWQQFTAEAAVHERVDTLVSQFLHSAGALH